MYIRRLTPADAAAFQALRLAALLEAPSAFASSYEEERSVTIPTIEERFAPSSDRGSFGAFEEGALVGLIALGREDRNRRLIPGYAGTSVPTPPSPRSIRNRRPWKAASAARWPMLTTVTSGSLSFSIR